MHVLIVSAGYPTTYDSKKSIFHQMQAEALVKNGCKVGVIAVVPVALREVLQKKRLKFGWLRKTNHGVISSVYQYLSLPKMRAKWMSHPLKKGKDEFEKYVSLHGVPEVVHLHSFQAGYLGIWIKEKYGVKLVVTEHSSRFITNAWSSELLDHAKAIFRECDYRIAVSPLFVEILSKLSGVPFHYLPNCVDTDFFQPEPLESQSEWFSFICVASFTANKNQTLIATSFLQTFTLNEKVRVVFYGAGEERTKVKNLFEDAGRSQQAVFVKDASREQLREWIGKSQVLLSASKVETFGITLIEAMSMGLPVIATRSGGPQAIVTDARLGFLVNEAQYGLKMKEMMENHASFDPVFIRKHAVENYSSHIVAQRLREVYQKL